MILAEISFDIQRLGSLANPFESIRTPIFAVAFLVLVWGFVANIVADREHGLKTILKVSVLCLFMASVPWLWAILRDLLYFFPEMMATDPEHGLASASEKMRSQLWEMQSDLYGKKENPSMMRLLWGAVTGGDNTPVIFIIISYVCQFLMFVASYITIPFYAAQYGLQKFFEVVLPLGIAAFAVPALQGKAANFVSATVSILLWPFGFAIVNALAMLSIEGLQVAGGSQGPVSTLTAVIFSLVPAGIMIFGMFSVPSIAYSICSSGASAAMPSGGSEMGKAAGMAKRLVLK